MDLFLCLPGEVRPYILHINYRCVNRVKPNRTANSSAVCSLLRVFQKITVCRQRCHLLLLRNWAKNLKGDTEEHFMDLFLLKN